MPQQQDDEEDPLDSSEKATYTQIQDTIERHQLALKMDMMDMMENHEKEIKFWKNKALRLMKKMSQEASLELDLPSTSSNNSEQKLMEKVSMLEKEVRNRDILIDSLRQTMEIHEKGNEGRVQLLENQLERLVEIHTNNASTEPLSDFVKKTRLDTDTSNTEGEKKDPTYEISVLEQLLVRVLAEKDKLLFENQNLRAILREIESTTSGSNAIPPETIHEECREEQFQDSDIGQNSSDGIVTDDESKPTEEKYDRVLYQLSCRNCQKNHSHIKYMGTCTGNVSDTQEALERMLEQHYFQIWKIVQEEDESISSSVHSDELNGIESNISRFSSSSLARHIAKHCQPFSNETDVLEWCRDNIKVEIQQGLDAKLPSSKRRHRKSSRKHKRRDNRGRSESSCSVHS